MYSPNSHVLGDEASQFKTLLPQAKSTVLKDIDDGLQVTITFSNVQTMGEMGEKMEVHEVAKLILCIWASYVSIPQERAKETLFPPHIVGLDHPCITFCLKHGEKQYNKKHGEKQYNKFQALQALRAGSMAYRAGASDACLVPISNPMMKDQLGNRVAALIVVTLAKGIMPDEFKNTLPIATRLTLWDFGEGINKYYVVGIHLSPDESVLLKKYEEGANGDQSNKLDVKQLQRPCSNMEQGLVDSIVVADLPKSSLSPNARKAPLDELLIDSCIRCALAHAGLYGSAHTAADSESPQKLSEEHSRAASNAQPLCRQPAKERGDYELTAIPENMKVR